MMNHIQSLINTAVENAKMEEKQLLTEKNLYLRRFRKEKKLRRKLQEQLDLETKKIQKLEAALKSLSYDTLIQIKESIAKEAVQQEKERQERLNSGSRNSMVSELQSSNNRSPE